MVIFGGFNGNFILQQNKSIGGNMKGFKVFNVLVILAMMLAFLPGSGIAKAQSSTFSGPGVPSGDFIPGQVVVKLSGTKTLSGYAMAASGLAGHVRASALKVGTDGTALLQGDTNADMSALVASVKSQPGVVYAEPNYIYRIPVTQDNAPANSQVENSQYVVRQSKDHTTNKVAISDLKALKSVRNGKITATYPNDPNLWNNWGWSFVGADIVSSNTTASAGICEIDTGVDYNHPDLKGRITKGYDFANGDADPMDDNGHGTHVAGIMTAVANNAIGIAGASTAKIVAVKALKAQGWGTSYDIAAAINYCANRTDVKVITMSLGGSESQMIYNALSYAINSKGKLVTAAAGNDDTDVTTNAFPAAFTVVTDYGPNLSNGLMAVAASGAWETSGSDTTLDYYCKADYSNYGSWVTIIGPGTNILSTTPYSTPFYLNYYEGVAPQYDDLSGTSMATPFVAAAAARRWGYKSTETNANIRNDLVTDYTYYANGDGTCWPVENNETPIVSVATLLDRGAAYGYVENAIAGIPLPNAQIQAYLGTALQGSGSVPSATSAYTEIINLPDTYPYTFKVNMSGYTNGPQPAFQHASTYVVYGGYWNGIGIAAIPPKSANFDVVTGWWENQRYVNQPSLFDLDMNVWLPSVPNPLDSGQPSSFIVGMEGNAFGYLENDPSGTLNAFPFATLDREGGYMDDMPFEDVTILARQAHSPLAANSALPYYPGTYDIQVTDYGQTIDHDNNSSTPEIPLMGVYLQPYVYIWKDGTVKLFVAQNGGYQVNAGDACNSAWWDAATITSSTTGAVTYTAKDVCNAVQAYSAGGTGTIKK
jgi:subtilisin family serine protease